MPASAQQRAALPRWQRLLLPSGLLEASGRRTARDWIVDLVMFAVAIGLGAAVLVETWPDHDGIEAVLDILIGAAACAALWVRRSRPVAVAVLTITASAFSALAAGPAVVAIFNAAIRAPWRALAGIIALTFAAGQSSRCCIPATTPTAPSCC